MDADSWLEVSVITDGEMAEAVAEVLNRYVAGGVVIESTAVDQSPEGPAHPVGPLRVRAYLAGGVDAGDRRREIEKALYYLGRIHPLAPAEFREVETAEWSESWKLHFQPVTVGEKLLLVPPWIDPPAGDRIAVVLDPGMAFGTGTHPSTRLCLAALEHHIRLGREFIDIGCGSGVLAIAALRLGAGRALAVDTDPLAVSATRDNALRNRVSDRLEVGLGSVRDLKAGRFTFRMAPLICANILAPVILRLLSEGLADLLAPEGVLVLSGILEEQEADVQAAAEAQGLATLERHQQEDWVALVTHRANG